MIINCTLILGVHVAVLAFLRDNILTFVISVLCLHIQLLNTPSVSIQNDIDNILRSNQIMY